MSNLIKIEKANNNALANEESWKNTTNILGRAYSNVLLCLETLSQSRSQKMLMRNDLVRLIKGESREWEIKDKCGAVGSVREEIQNAQLYCLYLIKINILEMTNTLMVPNYSGTN